VGRGEGVGVARVGWGVVRVWGANSALAARCTLP
jgi:hypothetical protein